MKITTVLIILFTSMYLQAAMDCSLPAEISGVEYCPDDNNYQTCSVDILNSTGVSEPRYFCLSEPTDTSVVEASAVFMFHGGGQIGKKVAKHWSNQQSGSFIILPNGKIIGGTRKWNMVTQTIPNFNALKPIVGHSDTEFVERILQELEAQYSCDNGGTDACIENYFATGFSSGAGMTFQLYTRNEFNDWFDGYGAVSNHLNKEQREAYESATGFGNATLPLNPRPIMLVIGTEETVNLPLASIIDVVESTPACLQPDFIEPSLHCYSQQVNQLSRSNRYNTSKWIRFSNDTIDLGVMSNYDLPTDDTMIASRFYAKNPANPNAKAVSIWTVINGGHYWPSINNQIPEEERRSKDIETSDELVMFWIEEAGFVFNQPIIFTNGFE